MIKPTVGRVVWYWPVKNKDEDGRTIYEMPHDGVQPLAAMIACVYTDTMVNLVVFDANGNSYSRCSVDLIQDGQPKPGDGYCEWMPYQKGQAAKTEQLQAQVNSGSVNENQEPPVKHYPQPRIA
jgi:hypothetical protein